jgi:hypothetical protein
MSNTYKPGTFLRFPLADGSFGYGRALEPPHDAFYEYRTESPDSDLDRIASKPILFRIAVRHEGLSAWEAIGWREVDERLAQPIVHFKQSLGDFRRCIIFDTAGSLRNVKPEECIGLERLIVWEQRGVEARLLDVFMGRPNDEVERMKVRLQ